MQTLGYTQSEVVGLEKGLMKKYVFKHVLFLFHFMSKFQEL